MKKQKDNKEGFFYKMTFDPLIARLYNKKRCNQCHGRGYVEIETPQEGVSTLRKHQPSQMIRIYCAFLNKNVAKQRLEERNNGNNKYDQ